jgi:GT2 family glycosyltransferase
MTNPSPKVAVCVVSFNSADEIPGCLQSIARSTYRPLEIVLVDCASRDASVSVAQQARPSDLPMKIVALEENLGFTGGMNRAIACTEAPWILSLNPDARPAAEYVEQLLARASGGQRIGAVTGRLRRPVPPDSAPILDACGMRLTLTWRHLDRGSGELDRQQWPQTQRVFGATGAASLFRRQALEDVAIDGDIFAPEFHSFREDAELCFRLRERGWEVVYEPLAHCQHRRHNVPARRREMRPEINYHSLKNRYLLRAYHQDSMNFLLTLVPTLVRDLLALLYVLTFERSSIEAYRWLWRHRNDIFRRRRLLRQRRTCTSWELNRWFIHRSLPL